MTGTEIYNTALSLMGESADRYYDQSALSCLNAILAECFEIENNIRRSKGETVLSAPQKAVSLNDEIIYADTLLTAAIPYGMASRLSISDGDMARTTWLQNLYNDAAQGCRKAVVGAIEDVYGGGNY